VLRGELVGAVEDGDDEPQAVRHTDAATAATEIPTPTRMRPQFLGAQPERSTY
jgi:hypothetical protein